MTFYIHARSGSGLIDELDLSHLCRLSLRRWYEQDKSIAPNSAMIRRQTEQFMQLLSEDAGVVAARALCIYSFLHLTLQEYFVCLGLLHVDHLALAANTDELVSRYLSLFSNRRLREPLNLALGWLSFSWHSDDFDYFCAELHSRTSLANKRVPVGALLFVDALEDLARLPSTFTVCSILSSLLDFTVYDIPCVFEKELLAALNRLPIELVNSWFDLWIAKDETTMSLRILRILYKVLDHPRKLSPWMTTGLCAKLGRLFDRGNEEISIYVDRILMLIGAINSDCLPTPATGMRMYLSSQSIVTGEMHSSILAAFIALYGGLEYDKTKQRTSVVFAARRIHRDSPLSALFIEYLKDTTTDRTIKLEHLIEQCRTTVTTAAASTNLEVVHSLVVLVCVCGIQRSSLYAPDVGSEVWRHALSHMKMVDLYLREFFCIDPRSNFKKNLTAVLQHFLVESKKDFLEFAQSLLQIYSRLLCAKTSFFVPMKYNITTGKTLINMKIPATAEMSNIADWDDEAIIRRLSFVCHLSTSRYDIETEELEAADVSLLQATLHPFQLLQHRPTALLLAFIPTSVQSLYRQLSSDETSCLPYSHLLVEFLSVTLTEHWCTIRLCVLLTVLSPLLAQYRLTNFTLFFITAEDFKYRVKNFAKFYHQALSHSLTRMVRAVESVQDWKNARELAMLEEQQTIDNAGSSDLQLYAACCCLAKLARKGFHPSGETLETRRDMLWSAVQRIKQPVWRLSAEVNICCILRSRNAQDNMVNDQVKGYFPHLIASLEELQTSTPLLSYVALVVRCVSLVHEDVRVERRLLDNILRRLKTTTMVEQLTICEALVALPPFHQEICQYVHQSQGSKGTMLFNQILHYDFVVFSQYLSSQFIPISDLSEIRSTLLASMYLSELTSSLTFLDDSYSKQTNLPIKDDANSLSMVDKCFQALEEMPIQLLTDEAASTISAFLTTSTTNIENDEEIRRVEQALMKKNEIVASARLALLEWLNYRYDQRFSSFAYQGALLLASSAIWTSTVVELCCELMSSDNDHLRSRAIEQIDRREWRAEKQSTGIIIGWVQHWNKRERKWLIEIEHLLSTLDLQTIDELEEILQAEKSRFHRATRRDDPSKCETKKEQCYGLSFFRLVQKLSSEVQNYLITVLESFSKCSVDSEELLFLEWLLNDLPCQISLFGGRIAPFLIDILLNDHPVQLKVVAARNLIAFPTDEDVQSALWKMINSDEQRTSPELVAACIWSLSVNENDEIVSVVRLPELDRLREHADSLLIRRAAVASLYSSIIKQPDKYGVIEVYDAYMIDADGRSRNTEFQGQKDDCRRRAIDWLIKHSSDLLDLLVEDLYANFDCQLTFNVPACIEVAIKVGEEIPDEFREAVQCSSVGEPAFWSRLYQISQTVCTSHFAGYFKLYECYAEVSPHYVWMLMRAALGATELSEYFTYETPSVSGRQSIELLFEAARSSLSMRQRCAAAELLVDLAIADDVSTMEVQALLNAIIEDPASQQLLHRHQRHERADDKLKALLHCLLVSRRTNGKLKYSSAAGLNISNKNVGNQFPAAIFEK